MIKIGAITKSTKYVINVPSQSMLVMNSGSASKKKTMITVAMKPTAILTQAIIKTGINQTNTNSKILINDSIKNMVSAFKLPK
tara:strand:+ start:203 stop:451 length:249 start_codon:yes stop_codon:yes gene_type:complete